MGLAVPAATVSSSATLFSAGAPSILRISSPAWKPALAAGESGATS